MTCLFHVWAQNYVFELFSSGKITKITVVKRYMWLLRGRGAKKKRGGHRWVRTDGWAQMGKDRWVGTDG